MASTQSTAFAAAIQSAVQGHVLQNLRDELVWADRSLAEHGSFEPMTDQLMFRAHPDLSITTPLTPLTEGTPPTARNITMSVTTIGSSQYGDLVGLTDIAKTVGPADVPRIAAERVSRTAAEVMDRIARDAIFVGGTPVYGSDSHTTRATLDNTDFLKGAHLIKIRAKAKKMNIPEPPDGYRLFVSQEQGYDLLRETTTATSFLDVSKYATPEKIVRGEIGKIHGLRIIATNRNPTVSSTVTVHQGVLVGGVKGWGVGDLQRLETFYTAPGGQGDPLHQNQYIGWKCMWGAGVLNNSYFLRLESFASTL